MEFHYLTHAQKRICYAEHVYPGTPINNLGGTAVYRGESDMAAMEAALNKLLADNPVLRLRYRRIGHEHCQYVEEYRAQRFELVDFGGSSDPQAALSNWVRNQAAEPFRFEQASLYKFVLLRLAGVGVGYYVKLHHFIADGWSFLQLGNQMAENYFALRGGLVGLPVEPKVEAAYSAVIDEEVAYLESHRFSKDKAYWLERYAQLPELDAYPKSRVTTGNRLSRIFSASQTYWLNHCGEMYSCSLNSVVVAIGAMLLSARYGQSDVTIGVPVFNRTSKLSRSMIGMFTSTMAARFAVDRRQSIRSYVQYVDQQLRKDLRHQRYPYDELIQDLSLAKRGFDGLFHLSVNYYNTRNIESYADVDITNREAYCGHQLYDLQFSVKPNPGTEHYLLDVDYKTDIYGEAEIEQLVESFFTLLQCFFDGADEALSIVSLVPSSYRQFVLHDFNKRKASYPSEKTVLDLIQLQMAKAPDAVAIQDGSLVLSYGTLEHSMLALACELVELGVQPGDVVAIMAPPSAELVVAILAVMKCGAVYCPIDVATPVERTAYMLSHANARLLLHAAGDISSVSVPVYPLGEGVDWSKRARRAEDLIAPLSWPVRSPDDPAYIIYTSGSTGRPKGVVVHHQGLINYIAWATATYLVGSHDGMALYSSPAFDLTVTTLFCPLTRGARIIAFRAEEPGLVLFDIMKTRQCTVLKLTPAHLNLIQMAGDDTSIHTLIVGGEALNSHLANTISKKFSHRIRIMNEYGPTETVVGCMTHTFEPSQVTGVDVPIGVPIANTAIYILDDYLQPVARYQRGDLYVGGDGVTLGYVNDKTATDRVFIANPFVANGRLYKTGDIASFDGEVVHYHGRHDHQIKLNGYRIECGDVEYALRSYPGVGDVKVVLKQVNDRALQLCAYLTGAVSENLGFREYLNGRLPSYMIPSHFICLPELPLTHNGKVDVKALSNPEPAFAARASTAGQSVAKQDDAAGNVSGHDADLIETLLAEAAAVLQMPSVAVHQNFIHLGGDSIKAIQLTGRLHDLGYQLGVKSIMSQSDFAGIAAEMSRLDQAAGFDQATGHGEIVATPIMRRWMRRRFSNIHHFNQCLTLKVAGEICLSDLEESLNHLILRHDVFRIQYSQSTASFSLHDQLIGKTLRIVPVATSDTVRGFRTVDELCEAMAIQLGQSIDVSGELLMTAGLHQAEDGCRYLCLCAHHLAVDGVSWGILLEQLELLLGQRLEKRAFSLPPKTKSFQLWAEQSAQSGRYVQEAEYWLRLLNDEPSSEYSESDSNLVGKHSKLMSNLEPSQTVALLTRANVAFSTTPQELLLVALAEALSAWLDRDSETIELESHGRHGHEAELSRTVGWFTCIHPFRLPLNISQRNERIKHIKEALRSVPNGGIGYGVLAESGLIAEQNGRRRIRFNYLGDLAARLSSMHLAFVDFKLSQSEDEQPDSLLDVDVAIGNSGLVVAMTFNEALLERNSVQHFMNLFSQGIRDVVAYCNEREQVEFSPSDFDSVNLDADDMDVLFGQSSD